MSDNVEMRMEGLCSTIVKTDSENWDQRNRAVLQMTEIIRSYEDQPPNIIAEAFTPNVFRALKEPVKLLIADLRSQQVRDACQLLILLAKVTGERMKPFLRDSFAHILEGIKIPNKLMSGYVDECIQSMIRFTVFKTGIITMVTEVKENKAKNVREKCLEYLNNILLCWELNDKDIEPICEAVKLGLEDASLKARETSRAAFHTLHQLSPKRVERIKADLPRSVLQKLQLDESSALDTSRDSLHELDRSASQLNMSAMKAEFAKAEPPSLAAAESLRSASVSRRRSVVKNPFAEISETFAGPSLASSSIDLQDFKSIPKAESFLGSPGKSPPAKSASGRDSAGSSGNFSPKQSDISINLPASLSSQRSAAPASESAATSTSSNTTAVSANVIGTKVYAIVAKDMKVPATIRFNGHTQFAPGVWIGVELESAIGKNNGSVQGHSYFHCKANYGLFLREENVVPFTNGQSGASHAAAANAHLSNHHSNGHSNSSGYNNNNHGPSHSTPSSSAKSNGSVRTATATTTTANRAARSNGSAASTGSNAGETAAEKRAKSASKLKLKLSQLMNFINQQLELVEDLEVEEKTNPVSTKALGLRREIKAITDRELETLSSFNNKWKEYL